MDHAGILSREFLPLKTASDFYIILRTWVGNVVKEGTLVLSDLD
jgi:hypothetical protein